MQTLGLKHWLNRPTTFKKIVWSIQSQEARVKIKNTKFSPLTRVFRNRSTSHPSSKKVGDI